MPDFAVADPEEGLNEQGNPNPVTPSTLGQRFLSGAATAITGSFTDLEQHFARQDTQGNYSEPRSSADEINARYPDLKVKEPLPMSVAANMNDAQAARTKQQGLLARYPTGFGNAALGLGADAVSGLLDPVGDAAFMIPVIGETRYAAWLARAGESAGLAGRAAVTLGVGAARGEVGQAILSAGKLGLADTGIGDYGLGDAAHDMLFAPVAGALMHGAFAFHGDILGARFLESPEFKLADAQTHDAAIRSGAAQLASGSPFDVRPVFDAAKRRSDLLGGTAVEAPPLDPEAQARTDNALARAAGAPSQDEVRWQADTQAARAAPEAGTASEGQIAEARAAVEQMRAAGHLTPEDEDLLARLEQEHHGDHPGGEGFRTNPMKIADEHDDEVRSLETAAFAGVKRPQAVEAAPDEAVVAARQHIEGARASLAGAKSPTLLQAIRKAGGIALRDKKGNYTPEGTVIRQILDKNNRGIINNKTGMRPDYMREHLAQQGWFADHPGAELDIQHLYDAIDKEARGTPVYHPHSETAQALAAHASLMEEMDHAGITGREPIEQQARALAEDRTRRQADLDAWSAAADRAGIPHTPESTPEEILADAVERDAVRAEANGSVDDFVRSAEGWIDDRIAEIDPDLAVEIRNQELEHEPLTQEHGAAGAADEGGGGPDEGNAGAGSAGPIGEGAADGGGRTGQLEIHGSEPSARQLAASREAAGAGRSTASTEQHAADIGLFAPPARQEPTLFMQRGGGNAPLEAGKKNVQARGVRRGADALINRLQMQVNLDRARIARGKDIAPMDRADVREVEDFVNFIGNKMFDTVGLRVLADRGPQGQFEVATHIVSIFRKAVESGSLTRTTIHELWHYLDQGLSRDDRVAVGREFQRARFNWLMENPWAESFIDHFSGDLTNHLVGWRASKWIEQHGAEDTPVRIGKTPDGRQDEVHFPWTEENYRYVNRDEYFAETMADKYLDFQDLQDQKAQSVFAHARAIWERMVSGFKQIFDGDATGRIFEGFRKGEQVAPLPPTGYGETLDSRVNESAPYGSRAFEKNAEQTERDQMDAAVAARQKLTAYQDLQKRQALIQAVQNFHDQTVNRPTLRHPLTGINRQLPLATSIDALTRGISEAVKGARESTASEQLARANDFLGGLQSAIDKIPGGMAAWRSRALTADWVRELHELNHEGGKPGATKSLLALDLAKAVKQAQDVAKMRLNQSGAWIGDYDGYVSRTQHNAVKIDQAGYQAWRDFTLARLDEGRTFSDLTPAGDADTFGANGSDEQRAAEIDRFLKGTWDGLSTGVHMSSQAGVGKAAAFSGPGSLGRKLSSERVLHWKDADAWREYQEKFGDPVIERGIMNSLHRAAHDAALMRRWGSNPQYTFDNLIRTVKEQYRDDHAAISEFQAAEGRLREEFAYLSGAANQPGNDLAFKIRSAVLGWQDITKLGNVLFAHFSAAVTKPHQMMYHGVGRWQSYTSVIRNLVEDSSVEGRQTLENLNANATGLTQDINTGYEPIDGVPGRIANLRMKMMRLGGLPWLLSRQKSGTEWELANFLGQRLGTEFEGLNQRTQRALKIYGIDKPEWDALRTAPNHDTDGQGLTYLTPQAAQRASDAAIDALAGQRAAGAGPADLARIRDETRDRLMMKLAGYYSDSADRSTVTPGIPERAMFSRLGGRFGGPIIGQYKTWAAAAVRQLWGQSLYGSSRGEAVKALAGLVAVGTAAGYLRMIAKDVASGRTPRMLNGDPKNDATLLLSAMIQGGGFGIIGDMILGQFEANAGSGRERALKYIATLAGPVIGDVADVGGVGFDYADAAFQKYPGKAFRAANAEALHLLTSHLPAVNLFYLRTLFNYMIFDRLYEMASPGYNKRYMDHVKKSSDGQTFFAPPTHYLGYQSYPAH